MRERERARLERAVAPPHDHVVAVHLDRRDRVGRFGAGKAELEHERRERPRDLRQTMRRPVLQQVDAAWPHAREENVKGLTRGVERV